MDEEIINKLENTDGEEANTLFKSRPVKIILGTLAIYNSSACPLGVFGIVFGDKHASSAALRSFVYHGLIITTVAASCWVALFYVLRRGKLAGVATALAAGITGIASLIGLVASIRTVFVYGMIESVFVLSCDGFLLWKVYESRKSIHR